MDQLDTRFYSRAEIAEALSLNIKSNNFARDVQSKLSKWGYKFQYIPRKGVEICSKPETPEERLRELLIRVFDMDTQIDAFQLACFIDAFSEIDGFESMPWGEREKLLENEYHLFVSEKTLRNWCSRLIDYDVIDKRDDKDEVTFWCTYYDGRVKYREKRDSDDEDMKKYFERKRELRQKSYIENLKSGMPQKEASREAWRITFRMLWAEFECCYYKCKKFDLAAFLTKNGDALQEVYELVNTIAATIHTSIAPQKTA